jgi:Uma2 family endonuclease
VSSQCAAPFRKVNHSLTSPLHAEMKNTYRNHHPGPADTALIIEVSASSLLRDRNDKGRIYARAGIPVYWIVNVVDRIVEVHTEPSGEGELPRYAKQEEFSIGSSFPIMLDGIAYGMIVVQDLMA